MGDLSGNPFSQLFPTPELAVEYRNMIQDTRTTRQETSTSYQDTSIESRNILGTPPGTIEFYFISSSIYTDFLKQCLKMFKNQIFGLIRKKNIYVYNTCLKIV